MFGIGFDAHVVHRLPVPLKRAFGRGAYVLQTLHDSVSYAYPQITVRLDDDEETQAASVIVSKGRFYGGHYLLAADAVSADPDFVVSLFRHRGACATLMYGAALPLNLLGRSPGVRQVRARRVDVVGNAAIPVQADGNSAGYAPLSVEAAPGPIEVVVGG